MKKLSLVFLLLLSKMASGQEDGLLLVFFDFDKHVLTEKTRRSLDSLLAVLDGDQRLRQFELHGHCDAVGADGYNMRLSEKRVESVKNHLLNRGINPAGITVTTGHGERLPITPNRTAGDRQLNRRVEITWTLPGKTGAVNQPINEDDTTSLKRKIADSATVAGTNIVLRNINFYGGRHHFLPASAPMLEELLDAMKTYPALVIRVEGHICCQPHTGDGLNAETGLYNLSEARAKAVKEYLVANGISNDRISYIGFGHSAPVYPYPEQSEEERVINRRVEIKIIRK